MCFDSFYLPSFIRMIATRGMRQQELRYAGEKGEMWYAGERGEILTSEV
jgi:hypothetical protein